MSEADLTPELLAVTGLFGIAAVWMLRRVMPVSLAVPVGLLKVLLPFLYFAFIFDGTWTFKDDMGYLRSAQDLFAHGYSPVTSLADSGFGLRLFMLSEGIHFLYTWWVMFALWVFGPHYWAPVYLNILVSVGAVVTLARMLEDAGLPANYRIGAACFFALNLDLVAWSSVLSLKDVLVMALTLVALRALLRIVSEHVRFRYILTVAVASILLTALRYYVPAILLAVTCGHFLLSLNILRRPLVSGLLIVPLVVFGGFWLARSGQSAKLLHLETLSFGLIRFLLTPQPWSLEKEYTFLLVPSIVNWATLPLLAFGLVRAWRDLPQLRLAFLYLFAMLFLYGLVPDLQGPRERVQLAPVLSLAVFHAIYVLIREIRALSSATAAETPGLQP